MGLWDAIGEAIFRDDAKRAAFERERREKAQLELNRANSAAMAGVLDALTAIVEAATPKKDRAQGPFPPA